MEGIFIDAMREQARQIDEWVKECLNAEGIDTNCSLKELQKKISDAGLSLTIEYDQSMENLFSLKSSFISQTITMTKGGTLEYQRQFIVRFVGAK